MNLTSNASRPFFVRSVPALQVFTGIAKRKIVNENIGRTDESLFTEYG
jgi:hypothetical protein